MNSQNIISTVAQAETAAARLDFADLVSRIEADNGKSTVEQYSASNTPARKIIGAAACFAAVVTLSAAALITIGVASGGMMAAESSDAACDMEINDAVAEECISEVSDEADAPTESEPQTDCITSTESTVESAVSESDVSDSDVSASDTGEEE